MIRLKVGQRWKRERDTSAMDSLALDLDGVDVLTGASAEPLPQVVPDWVEAVHSLGIEGESLAQLSLPEAHLEVCFVRRGHAVFLSIASLARPAQLTRKPVRLELAELMEASARGARALNDDLRAMGQPVTPRIRQMLRQVGALERGPKASADEVAPRSYTQHRSPASGLSFGFSLDDRDGLLGQLPKEGRAALASVLCDGAVWLAREGVELWRAEGPPFLTLLELSRQATEMAQSRELGEKPGRVVLAGRGEPAKIDWANDSLGLARAMFEVGLELGVAVTERSRAQAKNAYLQELSARCREGLSTLREAVPPSAAPRKSPRKASAQQKPLAVEGRLRKLRFELLWEKQPIATSESVTLVVGPRGPIVVSEQLAMGFKPDGALRFRRVAPHGVAVSRDGDAICAFPDRLLFFRESDTGARWLRDHDGLSIGPTVELAEDCFVGTSDARAAFAFGAQTGLEIWRVAPPRTQRCHLALFGQRALLATDSGYLYGFDLRDGQLRYRVRGALPFLGPPAPWGKKLVGALGRTDHFALLVADAHAGTVLWTAELSLSMPGQPLAIGPRVFVAGERSSDGVLVCLNAKGKTVWERALHIGIGPYALLQIGREVLVSSQSGAATLVDVNGDVRWHLGASGEPLNRLVAPVLQRKVLVLPGEQVRAVDPKTGQVFAEISGRPTLKDLQVDGKLNLYILDEDGSIRAYRLATRLSVVPSVPSP